MQVIVTLNSGITDTLSIEDWELVGKLKGYCKTNNLKQYEVNEIQYKNEPSNQNNSSECKG